MNQRDEKTFSPTVIQQEAIQWDDGMVLIQGVAGSGKTTVIAKRIERILAQSVNESFRILALTYTNKGKDVIRRLACPQGRKYENRLVSHTYHSFCADVLRQNGSHVNVRPDFVIYSSEEDLQGIIQDIHMELDKEGIKISIPITAWLPTIRNMQRNLIERKESDVNSYASTQKNMDAKELLQIFGAYINQLEQINALDYDTILYKTFLLFRDYPFVTNLYRSAYRYICIDELDGAPFAWMQILKEMTRGKYENIFAAANEDQLIYSFTYDRQLRPTHFFKEHFKPNVLQFIDNFRCPPGIQLVANKLLGKESVSFQSKPTDNIEVINLHSEKDELLYVANEIKKKYSESPKETFVVLTRTNKMARKVMEVMSPIIKIRLDRTQSDLDCVPLDWLQSILNLCSHSSSTRYLSRVLELAQRMFPKLPFNTEKIIMDSIAVEGDLYKSFSEEAADLAFQEGDQWDKDLLGLLKSFTDGKIDLKTYLVEILEIFNKYSNQDINGLFQNYESEIGIFRAIVQNNEPLTLSTLLQELALRTHEEASDWEGPVAKTIHRAQGEEYDHVYIVGMKEGGLPTRYSSYSESSLLEDRRICYVAITRTKKRLTMTFSESSPSRFIKDMGLEVKKH
ncbi:UvrD-helicase domain-containing protein [Paenibacillus silviterrae]|uniref:UvrD-helicase domain-containing protein n=1 Tax=Paenibacillus silviterrae TaxID=3242194 RepID=UPI002542DA62|nr:ATP-dependent helicase [Paenibacillus chinjuensis]